MAGILSKGTKLSYSTTSSGTFTELLNIQSFPDMGGAPERVDVTCLADGNRKYIAGIKDYGELAFEFLFVNDDATSNYRIIRGLEEAGGQVYFKLEFPDKPASGTNGTIFAFNGEVSTTVGGKSVNEANGFTMNVTLNSDITVTNPA